jgi:hypothetical protein
VVSKSCRRRWSLKSYRRSRRPPVTRVNKVHWVKIRVGNGSLARPILTTIIGHQDCPAPTHGPSVMRINEVHGVDGLSSAATPKFPPHAVDCCHNCAVVSDCPTVTRVNKICGLQGCHSARGLQRPTRAAVGRGQNRSISSRYPPRLPPTKWMDIRKVID